VFQKNYAFGILGAALSVRVPGTSFPTYPESRVWRLSSGAHVEAGRSLLDVNCRSGARDEEGVVCTAFDGARTRIVVVEPSTAAVTALGTIDGPFYVVDGHGPGGWLTGWWRSGPAAVHLDSRLGLRFPYDGGAYITLIAPAESAIGTAAPIDGGVRVRLYPLAGPTAALTRAR